MDSFLHTAYPLGHLTLALIELVILIFAYPFFRLSNNWAMIVLPLILVSTIYENGILWSGEFIGVGNLLENLSQVRFLLYYSIVPLFIVVAVELAHSAGAGWANKLVRVLSWLVAFAIATFDITQHFVGLELVPTTFAGVLRYVPSNPEIPISTIVVNVFVLLVPSVFGSERKLALVVCRTLIGLLGNALPSQQFGPLPGSAAECLLALSLLLTQYHLEDELKPEPPTPTDPPEGWHVTEYEGYQIFWKEEKPEGEPAYTIYQTGSHKDGDFIRIYVPENPYQEKANVK